MVDHHRILLPLPPQPCVHLLVQFQRPGKPEPYQRGASRLQVQPMPCGRRVDHRYRNLPGIPPPHILRRIQLHGLHPLPYPLQVMPVPVSHQHRLPVRRLHQILQSLQLPVMDTPHPAVLVIDRPVRHLQQLVGEPGGVHRVNIPVRKRQQHIFLQLPIQLHLPPAHGNLHPVIHTLRHIQIVTRPHADTDIRDQSIDCFLRPVPGLVGEHHLPAPLIRQEEPLPVSADEPPKPLPHVQQPDLRP